jgi:hypothetical protein
MFLVLFFLLLFVSPIYGDAFNISGDGSTNEYYQTVALTVEAFPMSFEEEEGIQYDTSSVFGLNTTDVLLNYDLSILSTLGGMRRIGGMVDRVDGPPGTSIDLIYLYRNDTGHSINISKIGVPFSRNIPSMGDFTNIVEFNGEVPTYTVIPVSFNGTTLLREGKIREYMGMGVLQTSSIGNLLLDTVTIANPITIDNVEYLEDRIFVVSITNRSTEKLNNITFEYGTFVNEFDMYPSESRDIEYILDDDFNYFKIYNPNIKTECIILGSSNYNWFQMSAVTVLAYREDGGWVNGAYVQPEQESFCITRLPYSMTSQVLQYERSMEDDNIVRVEENNPKKIVLENVLGIQEEENFLLPKTAKKIY